MKKINYSQLLLSAVFIVTVAVLSISLTGCPGDTGSDPDPDTDLLEEQKNALKNNGTSWVLASGGVVKDGYEVTDQFTEFKLTIGEFTYNTENSIASAWPASGNWEFNNDQGTSVLRDDGVAIGVGLSGTNLTLNFSVTITSGGRIDGLSGDYIFNLMSE